MTEQTIVDAVNTDTINNIGALALQEAIFEYMNAANESDRASFEIWVHAHAQDTDFLQALLGKFPPFETILINTLQSLATTDTGAETGA